MYIGLRIKQLLFLYVNEIWISSTDCRENTEISDVMKLNSVGAEVFHVADGWTDGTGETNGRFSPSLHTRLKTDRTHWPRVSRS